MCIIIILLFYYFIIVRFIIPTPSQKAKPAKSAGRLIHGWFEYQLTNSKALAYLIISRKSPGIADKIVKCINIDKKERTFNRKHHQSLHEQLSYHFFFPKLASNTLSLYSRRRIPRWRTQTWIRNPNQSTQLSLRKEWK